MENVISLMTRMANAPTPTAATQIAIDALDAVSRQADPALARAYMAAHDRAVEKQAAKWRAEAAAKAKRDEEEERATVVDDEELFEVLEDIIDAGQTVNRGTGLRALNDAGIPPSALDRLLELATSMQE
jgi:hypothetical protein